MTDATWIPIAYREFYDIPRSMVVRHEGACYYLESSFDRAADEYNDYFDVYRLPPDVPWEGEGADWTQLAASGEPVGRIDAARLQFDSTKRRQVDGGLFDLVR